MPANRLDWKISSVCYWLKFGFTKFAWNSAKKDIFLDTMCWSVVLCSLYSGYIQWESNNTLETLLFFIGNLYSYVVPAFSINLQRVQHKDLLNKFLAFNARYLFSIMILAGYHAYFVETCLNLFKKESAILEKKKLFASRTMRNNRLGDNITWKSKKDAFSKLESRVSL